MRVFIAGGSGAIGRRLVPLLAARGHEVTATTRSAAKAEILRGLGAKPVVLDALNEKAVRTAVEAGRAEVVVHQLTALAGIDYRRFDASFARTNELRTRGTDILLDAARGVGARVVAQSYFSATHPSPPTAMAHTIAAMRHVERSVPAAGGLVLRYGGFYGPGTSLARDGEVADLLHKRRYPLVGEAGGIWSLVHVDDAAAATAAAIESAETGILDIADDDPAPVSTWLPYLADALGAPPPRRLPAWLARVVAGDAVVWMSTELRGVSNAEAKQRLGWQLRWASWRDGFRHGLAEEEAAAE